MYCNKCGNHIEPGTSFCNKCGNMINNDQNNNTQYPNFYNQNETNYSNQNMSINTQTINNQNYVNYNNQNLSNNGQYNNMPIYNQPNNKKLLIVITACVLIIILVLVLSLNKKSPPVYINPDSPGGGTTPTSNPNPNVTSSQTIIITDHTYEGVSISNKSDAVNLIVKDSVSQKDSCSPEIVAIENEIIEKYGVKAVNLCEMDVEFAREVSKVFKKIYNEYPNVKEYLTNLSLINASATEGYIACFMPFFIFARSDSSTTYPWVNKTQILLNTSYFLNKDRIDTAVKSGSASGHFPKNATPYSAVAHELGHYLSFIALMKYYQSNSVLLLDNDNVNIAADIINDFKYGDYSLKMIKEAYEKCKKEQGITLDFDSWRGTISKYALAKNNYGEYIYDETIAEAFHDVYLNGDNAAQASKYIVSILKEKLESR